ncbi:hypothetical protein PMIN01_00150 [Paraphaeosphaeria minitans]|uniref:Uncharacterized protein n=1 Tax=Paraphaeosphaeria minitans TaxID=565426 RepID=A0A9P6GSM1_9PLEO|nr:hypothetical protein PMIN01_00150 [Paraphaeosphaeria minitans]
MRKSQTGCSREKMTCHGLLSNAATVGLSGVVPCAVCCVLAQSPVGSASSHSQPRGDHFGRAPPTFIRPFTLPDGDAPREPAGCCPLIRHVRALRKYRLATLMALRVVAANPLTVRLHWLATLRNETPPQTLLESGA